MTLYIVTLDPNDVPRRYLEAAIGTVIILTWFFLISIAAILKIVEGGFAAYFSHFTNWAWTLGIFFFGSIAAAPFIKVGLLRPNSILGIYTLLVLALLFFPLWGIAWTVLVVVSVLLITNSPFLLEFFANNPPGFVFIGNEIFHFWPVLALVITYIFIDKALFYALNWFVLTLGIANNPCTMVLFILSEVYIGALFFLLLYNLAFNANDIYQTDIPFVYGLVVVLITLTIASGGLLLYILGVKGILRRRRLYGPVWLWRNDADPELAGGVIMKSSQ